MLSGRLKGAASAKVAGAVTAALIASVVSAIVLVLYLDQSSELREKSRLVLSQQEEILAATQAMEAQRQELGAKTAELAQAQSQLSAAEMSLQAESDNSALLEAEISVLVERIGLLEAESTALQTKIAADEKRIAELVNLSAASERATISHFGLGVDQNNEGIVFPIRVEIIESGTGILSVDINNVQYEPGFQAAVRAAAIAAAEYSGENLSEKDIIVRFSPEGSHVGGELVKVDGSSAGAVIAAMIAAGLSNAQLNQSVLVTGAISEDGTVGRIGSLEEKFEAAQVFGADAVIVPKSQEFESEAMPVIGVSDINELMDQMLIS